MHERHIIRTAEAMCDDLDARRAELIADAERKALWLVCGLAVIGGVIGGTLMEYALTAYVAGML
jgi:energy-converting hydrogenase Eha subunit H